MENSSESIRRKSKSRREQVSDVNQLDKLIENMELNSFRYFDNFTMSDFERMTIREYEVMLKAYKLRNLDKEYFIHLQAFKNQEIKATKKVGKQEKMVYKNFNEFFPYQKRENEILGIATKKKVSRDNKKMMELLKKANS
ncbi:MAG: hypothetical protein ACRCVH_00455 [Vagococcus fluvialis]